MPKRPESPEQKKLFLAVAHGFKPTGSARGLSQGVAKRTVSEWKSKGIVGKAERRARVLKGGSSASHKMEGMSY